MNRARIRTALVAALISCASAAHAEWITSWSAAPVPPMAALGPIPATPSFENRTIRQTLRLSSGGSALRIRLSNAYGAGPLDIGRARIALLDANGTEIAGTSRMLSFGGGSSTRIPAGAPIVSDSVALQVPALARLSLSLYLPGNTGPCTCHATGLDDIDLSPPGDFTPKPFTGEAKLPMRPFAAAVEVDTPGPASTLVVLGDSISDGVGSTPNVDRRWPDRLAERLAARGGRSWGVANQGISGNRILSGGMGESALTRLDRDVFSLPGVRSIILFEGVNDLGMSFGHFEGPMAAAMRDFAGPKIDAAQMIAGYRQIIARAHALGIKVYGATIAPYKGASYWSPEGEAARQQINAFVRSGGAFDGVLDFDKVVQDPADPASIRADYHMGDHLHGTDAAYKAMADSIDLALFAQ